MRDPRPQVDVLYRVVKVSLSGHPATHNSPRMYITKSHFLGRFVRIFFLPSPAYVFDTCIRSVQFLATRPLCISLSSKKDPVSFFPTFKARKNSIKHVNIMYLNKNPSFVHNFPYDAPNLLPDNTPQATNALTLFLSCIAQTATADAMQRPVVNAIVLRLAHCRMLFVWLPSVNSPLYIFDVAVHPRLLIRWLFSRRYR